MSKTAVVTRMRFSMEFKVLRGYLLAVVRDKHGECPVTDCPDLVVKYCSEQAKDKVRYMLYQDTSGYWDAWDNLHKQFLLIGTRDLDKALLSLHRRLAYVIRGRRGIIQAKRESTYEKFNNQNRRIHTVSSDGDSADRH